MCLLHFLLTSISNTMCTHTHALSHINCILYISLSFFIVLINISFVSMHSILIEFNSILFLFFYYELSFVSLIMCGLVCMSLISMSASFTLFFNKQTTSLINYLFNNTCFAIDFGCMLIFF